ncbi:DMT family transporter [Mycoplasmatota bacterium zrk1]
MKNMQKSLKYELLLLMVALIWGVGFPVTKIAVQLGFGPFAILAGRFIIASIVLSTIFRKNLVRIDKRHILFGLLTGMFLFASFSFQTVGILYTTPSKNAFITQMMVILVPFLYWFVYKEKPSKYAFIGAFVALIGGLALTFNSDFTSGINKGDILTFGCAVLCAVHIIASTHFAKKEGIDSIAFTLVQFYLAGIIALVIALFNKEVPRVTLINWWPLVFMGLLNTGLGFTIQTFAHKYSTPTKTSIIVSTEAVFGSIASVLIIGEPLTVQLVIGGLLIFIAVITVETRFDFFRRNR